MLKFEIKKGMKPIQSVLLIQEASQKINAFVESQQKPEDLNPSDFAPVAIWYEVLKTIYSRVLQLRDSANPEEAEDMLET